MDLNINQFMGKVTKIGTNSLMVLIPQKNAQYEGLQPGDTINVAIKKTTKEEE